MEPAYKLLTVEEFLDACPNDQRHYQLFDGIIVAMAPPAVAHQIIAGNLTSMAGLLFVRTCPIARSGTRRGSLPTACRDEITSKLISLSPASHFHDAIGESPKSCCS
jgi:Uma2 family endonuclease